MIGCAETIEVEGGKEITTKPFSPKSNLFKSIKNLENLTNNSNNTNLSLRSLVFQKSNEKERKEQTVKERIKGNEESTNQEKTSKKKKEPPGEIGQNALKKLKLL